MIDYNGNVLISTGMEIPVITDVTFWGNFSSFHFVMQMGRCAADNSNDHASTRLSLRLPDVPEDLQHLLGSSGWDPCPLPGLGYSLFFFVFSPKNGFLHVFNLLLSSKPKHHAWLLSKHFTGVAVPAKKPTNLNQMSSLKDTEMQSGLDSCPNSLSSCCTLTHSSQADQASSTAAVWLCSHSCQPIKLSPSTEGANFRSCSSWEVASCTKTGPETTVIPSRQHNQGKKRI